MHFGRAEFIQKINIDYIDKDGIDQQGWLNHIYALSSSPVGNGGILHLRVSETKFLLFNVTGVDTTASGYRSFIGNRIGQGTQNPSAGEIVSVSFTPKGFDGLPSLIPGPTGPTGAASLLYVDLLDPLVLIQLFLDQ